MFDISIAIVICQWNPRQTFKHYFLDNKYSGELLLYTMRFINDVIELEYLQRDFKVLFSIINLPRE